MPESILISLFIQGKISEYRFRKLLDKHNRLKVYDPTLKVLKII